MTLIQHCNKHMNDIFVKIKTKRGHYINASLAQLSASEILENLEKWEEQGFMPHVITKETEESE